MKQEELARLAAVSPSTVSKALSGRGALSEATRERIIRIAAELGYQPHGLASALAHGKSGFVGIVISDVEPLGLSHWHSAIISGVLKGLSAGNVELVLIGERRDAVIPRAIARRSVDGVILMIRAQERIRDWLAKRSFPCVTVDQTPLDESDSVNADDAGGVDAAIRYLASLGHRRIGYVNTFLVGSARHDPSVARRHTAYLKAMAELGLQAPPGSELNLEVEERVAGLLATDPPTALLCYNDEVAIKAIWTLGEKGVRVPHEMNIVGIDDLARDPHSLILTTVHVPFHDMGQRALELLCARIADPQKRVERVELPETLVPRKTTCPIGECSAPAGGS